MAHDKILPEFPSPIGELHFSIFESSIPLSYRAKVVSVPYRGATFLNNIKETEVPFDIKVSVPYRGATFLNTAWIVTAAALVFPSPIGELHFSMLLSAS